MSLAVTKQQATDKAKIWQGNGPVRSSLVLWRFTNTDTQAIRWGNMTAIDVINVGNNEGTEGIRNKDLSLAFIGMSGLHLLSMRKIILSLACGDLRNVVRTINGLPENYSGTIKIVLNDMNPMAVCRNLIILSILGIIEDVVSLLNFA